MPNRSPSARQSERRGSPNLEHDIHVRAPAARQQARCADFSCFVVEQLTAVLPSQIGIRLPLDHDAVVEAIVTDIEVVHSYIEVWTLLRKGEQSRSPFGKVDAENVPSCRHVCSGRIFTFDVTLHGALACGNRPNHSSHSACRAFVAN